MENNINQNCVCDDNDNDLFDGALFVSQDYWFSLTKIRIGKEDKIVKEYKSLEEACNDISFGSEVNSNIRSIVRKFN